MAKSDNNRVVGLDIGTSKVLVIVAEISPDGDIEIIGVGHHPARGMRKGVVADIESTVRSIQCAVEEAELMSGCDIYSVHAGIAGAHINSFNSHGVVAIRERDAGVSISDIDRVIEAAKAIVIPDDQTILHEIPQEFIIDGQEGIREPVGMCGVRLEAKVHIITGAKSAAQNITKCIQRCGLEVEMLILEQLASSQAVLSEDEKALGVCLVDIGGGTTDIAVFVDGAICHTAVIPIAGDQVTNDIAVALRAPRLSAEEIKHNYGCALVQLAGAGGAIEVPGVGDRPPRKLARQTLAEVIEPRVEELFGLVQAELQRSGLEKAIGSGVVLTGGSSRMEGMADLAEEVFHLPVRLGVPNHPGALQGVASSPLHATGVGLIQFGHGNRRNNTGSRQTGRAGGALERLKGWFQNF